MRLVFLLTLFACLTTSAQVSDSFMDRLEQRESGGRNVAGRDGERGVCQMRRIAWADVNNWRKTKGYPQHPFSAAWDPVINRAYARQFAEIQQRRLRAYLRREPTEAEIYRAFNRGFEVFKRGRRNT